MDIKDKEDTAFGIGDSSLNIKMLLSAVKVHFQK